jgi:bifunctional DNA-binding transcriptional regulator/antitoxin component of YhaV-PrlF toxin-antitoxin module
MAMAKRLAISRGGQVSVPAAVRKRWGTNTVVAEDHGDHLVLRPAPDDPIAAVRGIFAEDLRRAGKTVDEIHREWREEEAEIEERKFGHIGRDTDPG